MNPGNTHYHLKDQASHTNFRNFFAIGVALILLGAFTGVNYFLHEQTQDQNPGQAEIPDRDQLTDTSGFAIRRLACHDFESGNGADTASHLACKGYNGKQSLKMSGKVPFSPGLWIRFKDLNPGDSSWICVTGYVWFSCPASEAKCSLVATCNHNGINYKYMFIPIEKESVKPGQWNRISLSYHIPPAPGGEDVLQAYFWYRGSGEMLVDDITVDIISKQRAPLRH